MAKVVREGVRLLEGVEVENDAHLTELLERDINALDTKLYYQAGGLQMPVHVDRRRRRRSGARNHIIETGGAE